MTTTIKALYYIPAEDRFTTNTGAVLSLDEARTLHAEQGNELEMNGGMSRMVQYEWNKAILKGYYGQP